MIDFDVRGIPVTQGSARARVVPGTDHAYVVPNNRSNLVAWRHSISDEARKATASKMERALWG